MTCVIQDCRNEPVFALICRVMGKVFTVCDVCYRDRAHDLSGEFEVLEIAGARVPFNDAFRGSIGGVGGARD
jgi:hypothetical protein